jgi:TRAP-type transport system periplasmic protein
MKPGFINLLLLQILTAAGFPICAQTTVTLATHYAPGSAVTAILNKAVTEVSKRSDGRLALKVFYNGIQGAEPTLVSKMKKGQLDGALLTAEGLRQVHAGLQVLELPMLITTSAEAKSVHFGMADRLDKMFSDGGFTLACWADPGTSYLFSRDPVNGRAELEGLRTGILAYDATGRAFLLKCQANVIPMGDEEISPSLQTGSIIACLGTSADAVNQQWSMKLTYAVEDPLRYRSGAVVFRKGLQDKLPKDLNKVLMDAFSAIEADLENLFITTNASASKALEQSGVEFIRLSPAALSTIRGTAASAWVEKSGTLYPAEVLDKVRGILKK